MRILSWITHARGPVSVEELRHGLAVEYSDSSHNEGDLHEFDEDNLLSPESIVDVCAGLVVIDSTSQIVRLVHYTTQEYFERGSRYLFKCPEVDLSKACLAYLSYDIIHKFAEVESNTKGLLLSSRALHMHPFLDYACHHWFSHVKSGLLVNDPDRVPLRVLARFNSSKSKLLSSDLLLYLYSRESVQLGGWTDFLIEENEINSKEFPLHVASTLGLEELVTVLLDHNTRCCPGLNSSLVIASCYGHMNVVKLLLQSGAQVGSTFALYGGDPMHCSCHSL